MAQMKAYFHGGPLHGTSRAVEDNLRSIEVHHHTARDVIDFSESDSLKSIRPRVGKYSKVRGKFADFEWDGWNGY